MGLKTMVSPSRRHAPHFPAFARHGALYNLSIDEVQTQLENSGKTMDGLNLDELVKSVIATEHEQVVENVAAVSSSSSNAVAHVNLNLNRTRSRKAVDDVWKETVHQEQGNAGHEESVQRQPTTLGETTLEEFLARAGAIKQDGVVDEQSLVVTDSIVAAASQQADWFQFQMAAVQQQQQNSVFDSNVPHSASMFGASSVDVGYHENQLALSMPMTMPLVAASPAESQAPPVDRKRRFSDGILEKTIERRQKRMIKNRESAARSRAKKQAYTNKLEQDKALLEKINKSLNNEKEMDRRFPSFSEPRYQLRRTSSEGSLSIQAPEW